MAEKASIECFQYSKLKWVLHINISRPIKQTFFRYEYQYTSYANFIDFDFKKISSMLTLYLKVSLPIILPTDLKSDTFLVPLQIIGGIHKMININKILTLIEQSHLVRHVKETFSCRFILIPFIKFSIFFLIHSSFSVTFFFFFF